jgi:2-dehydro-3-deoxyphosphogluconate aldolase/(4S)-4-hydroxy-2-oxoglutarate aldolase
MTELFEKLYKIGIIPVVKINDSKNAVPMAKALCRGGIPVAEITLRTGAGVDAIREIAGSVPEMIVGAGTVVTIDQAKAAVSAGAQFIESPGFSAKLVEWCKEKGVTIIPGVSSATEIVAAMEYGLDVLKFFPAESSGGAAAVKSFAGPFGDLKFIPTGGIGESNLKDYLSLKNVVACGGSWMVSEADIDSGNFGKIEAAAKSAVLKMLNLSLLHVGINTKDAGESSEVANKFGSLLAVPVTEYPGAFFAGSVVEVIKGKYLGDNGHIGFSTDFLARAIGYFERQGAAFNEDTILKDASGNIINIYLKDQIGGFAVHIKQK